MVYVLFARRILEKEVYTLIMNIRLVRCVGFYALSAIICLQLLSAQTSRKRVLNTYSNTVVQMKTSWYGPGFEAKLTACNSIFHSLELTVAHRTLACGTRLRLTRLSHSLTVTVTDRGPALWTKRDLDVSERVAELLGFKEEGVTWLSVSVVRSTLPTQEKQLQASPVTRAGPFTRFNEK